MCYTARHRGRKAIPIPRAMVESWWPGAQFPLAVSLATAVGGQARGGGALQASVRRHGRDQGHQYILRFSGALPLAVGSPITHFKRAGPAAVELHASEPASGGGGGSDGGGSGSGGAAAAGAGGRALQLVAAPPPANAQPAAIQRQPLLLPRQGPQLVTEQEASGTIPCTTPSGCRALALCAPAGAAPAGGGSGGAAACLAGPDSPACAVGAAGAAVALEAAGAAVLRSLQLPELAPRSAADEREVADACVAAVRAADRAAAALGLRQAQYSHVRDAAAAAAAHGSAARRFLFVAAEYRQLRLACAEGDAAAALRWMAARGGR